MPDDPKATPALRWRKDEFGNVDRALYIGRLYIGHIMHCPKHPRRPDAPWRAWLMTSDEGDEAGWYASEADAKAALHAAAMEALAHAE